MHTVAIVANTSFNIVNFRLPLMQFLRNYGMNVIAIAPEDEYTSIILSNNFKFIPLQKLSRKGTNPVQDLQLLIELKNIYKKEIIDIALQYTIKPNIYGSLASLFSKTKTICTVTGLGYTFLNSSIASTVSKLLYKIAFHFADTIYFQNKDDAELFIKKKLANKRKINIINGSGIDTDYYSPNFCSVTEKSNEHINFLFIGRLLKDKGVIELLEAAKEVIKNHQKISFSIVGDIDTHNPSAIQQQTLQKYLVEDKIMYLGHQKDTRMAICQTDCIILPSYREGLPRVLLEAMAMQKPCITTDVAGCRDAVDSSCALLAKVADSNSLIQCIEQFIELSIEEKKIMGINARKRAEELFSIEIIAQDYLAKILNLFNES